MRMGRSTRILPYTYPAHGPAHKAQARNAALHGTHYYGTTLPCTSHALLIVIARHCHIYHFDLRYRLRLLLCLLLSSCCCAIRHRGPR